VSVSDQTLWNPLRLGTAYKLAIEVGRYRSAAVLAVAALRLDREDQQWRYRLRGAWVRRRR
jgi:hypothetical protein